MEPNEWGSYDQDDWVQDQPGLDESEEARAREGVMCRTNSWSRASKQHGDWGQPFETLYSPLKAYERQVSLQDAFNQGRIDRDEFDALRGFAV